MEPKKFLLSTILVLFSVCAVSFTVLFRSSSAVQLASEQNVDKRRVSMLGHLSENGVNTGEDWKTDERVPIGTLNPANSVSAAGRISESDVHIVGSRRPVEDKGGFYGNNLQRQGVNTGEENSQWNRHFSGADYFEPSYNIGPSPNREKDSFAGIVNDVLTGHDVHTIKKAMGKFNSALSQFVAVEGTKLASPSVLQTSDSPLPQVDAHSFFAHNLSPLLGRAKSEARVTSLPTSPSKPPTPALLDPDAQIQMDPAVKEAGALLFKEVREMDNQADLVARRARRALQGAARAREEAAVAAAAAARVGQARLLERHDASVEKDREAEFQASLRRAQHTLHRAAIAAAAAAAVQEPPSTAAVARPVAHAADKARPAAASKPPRRIQKLAEQHKAAPGHKEGWSSGAAGRANKAQQSQWCDPLGLLCL